jgi:hypothetical protein
MVDSILGSPRTPTTRPSFDGNVQPAAIAAQQAGRRYPGINLVRDQPVTRCRSTRTGQPSPGACRCAHPKMSSPMRSAMPAEYPRNLRPHPGSSVWHRFKRYGKPAAGDQAKPDWAQHTPHRTRSTPSLIFRATAPRRWDPGPGPIYRDVTRAARDLHDRWVDPAHLEVGRDDVLEAAETRLWGNLRQLRLELQNAHACSQKT